MIARRLMPLLLLSLSGTAFAGPTWTIPVGWMGDLTSDGTSLYMTTMVGSRPTSVLQPSNGALIRSFEQRPFVTAAPRGAAFDGEGHLWLTSMSPDVCALDKSGSVLGCIVISDPVPDAPDEFRSGALAFDGTYLYVGDIDTNTVVVTDTAGSFLRYFDSGRRAEAMAFDPSTGDLWILDLFVADQVTEITTDGALVRDCRVPFVRAPSTAALGGLAIMGSKFYVAEPLDPERPEDGTLVHVLQRESLACDPPIHRPSR